MSNTTIHEIPQVFYWGHVSRTCRPRQLVDIVGSKKDSRYMRFDIFMQAVVGEMVK